MSNSEPESLPLSDNLKSTSEQSKHSNKQQQRHSLPRTPWVGIKQYTNEFSSKKASPGYIARARSIYNNLCSDLSNNHTSSRYVAIEPDSGEYFLNANKEAAIREARIKHPGRLICTFQLTGAS